MKTRIQILFLLTGLTILSGTARARPPVKKVFAYKQASIPGIRPNLPANVQRERKQTYNYWIYLGVRSTGELSFSEIWIEGKKFTVKAEEAANHPIIKLINTGTGSQDTLKLVPENYKRVILVYPSGEPDNQAAGSRRLKRLTRKNELVIVYNYKGKKCYARSGTIKELEPDVHV
jgi:hypothetical protein